MNDDLIDQSLEFGRKNDASKGVPVNKPMSAVRKRRRPAKPDLSDESDAGGIDDLDLAQRREEPDELDAETPAQKRLRLARSYLEQVKADVRRPAEVADGVFEFSAEDVDRELIADRLVQDQLEAAGKAFHRVADTLVRAKPDTFELDVGEKDTRFFGGRTGHRLAVTGLAFATQKAATGRPPVFLYSVSKDSNIIKWDFYTGKEIQEIHGELKRTKKRKKQDRGRKKERDPTAEPPQGHVDEIWSIAVSSDGKYLVSYSSEGLQKKAGAGACS